MHRSPADSSVERANSNVQNSKVSWTGIHLRERGGKKFCADQILALPYHIRLISTFPVLVFRLFLNFAMLEQHNNLYRRRKHTEMFVLVQAEWLPGNPGSFEYGFFEHGHLEYSLLFENSVCESFVFEMSVFERSRYPPEGQ